jgi:hypothetical protein
VAFIQAIYFGPSLVSLASALKQAGKEVHHRKALRLIASEFLCLGVGGVFVGAMGGVSIPLPPALAGSNFHHDGRHLVNLQTIPN